MSPQTLNPEVRQSPKSPEGVKPRERVTRMQVRDAFGFSFNALQRYTEEIRSIPEGKRTELQKKRIADFNQLQKDRMELSKNGRPTIEINRDGKTISTNEWISIDGTLDFMRSEVNNLQEYLKLPANSHDRHLKTLLNAYQHHLAILEQSCVTHEQIKGGIKVRVKPVGEHEDPRALIREAVKEAKEAGKRELVFPDLEDNPEKKKTARKSTNRKKEEGGSAEAVINKPSEEQPKKVKKEDEGEKAQRIAVDPAEVSSPREQLRQETGNRGDSIQQTQEPGADVQIKSNETRPTEVVVEHGRQPPFVEDNPDNQSGRFTFAEAKTASAPPSANDTERVIELRGLMNRLNELINDPEFRKVVQRNAQESEQDYRIRSLTELSNRMTFLGDNERAGDQLSKLLLDRGLRDRVLTPQLLQAAEASYYVELDNQNKAMTAQYEKAQQNGKFDIATIVSFERGVVDISGSASIYENTPDGLRRKEMAERDMRAAQLLTNALANVPYEEITDPINGTKRTISFNEKMGPLLERQRNAKTPQEKEDLARLVRGEYKIYLNRVKEVMLKDQYTINPFDTDELFHKEAFNLIQDLKPFNQDKINKLIDLYSQNPSFKKLRGDIQDNTKNKIRATFGKDMGASADFLGYAQKGVDLLERRMELSRIPKPKLHEIPKVIYAKRWKEDGEFHRYKGGKLQEAASEIRPPQRVRENTGREPLRSAHVSEKAKTKSVEKTGDLPPAPLGKETLRRTAENLPQAPVEGRVKKETETREKHPESKLTSAPIREETRKAELEELQTDFNFAAAGLKDRRVQNVLQGAQHLAADDLNPANKSAWYRFKDKLLGWSYRVPLVGGVVRSIAHPVQLIWQNGLAKSIFEQQKIRFVSDVQDILKTQSDSSIPVDVSPELLDKALAAGRDIRKKQNIFRRAVWSLSDFGKGILGISQTSEQILAKQWLNEQVKSAPTARDAELNAIYNNSLVEQGRLGDRYARFDSRSGLSLTAANRVVLSNKAGETRHRLENVEQANQVNSAIKTLIEKYASGQLNDDELVKETNKYLLGDFQKNLTADQQKEFKAPEVASNILSIARQVTGKNEQTGEIIEANRWQRYQNEKSENGKTKWEEVQFSNILFGKSEWGGVRGKVEVGALGIADRLARHLAERPSLWNKSGAGAWAMTKDIITNAAFFAAGGGTSVISFGANIPLRTVGGLVGIGVGAGLKETGIGFSALGIKGIKGRYVKEVEQLSREIARGRTDIPNARIRAEMRKALVLEQMKDASQLAETLENLASKEVLAPEDAKRLLLAMADVDARMNLTDLSGKREVNFKVQNFIKFNQGHENDEYDRLRGALYQGMLKLAAADVAGVSYRDLNKYSAVAAAQLRFSSDDLKRVKQWVNHNDPSLKYDEIEKMVGELNLGVKKSESLRAKESILRKLTVKRGISTAAKAALTGFVAPAVYAVPAEALHLVSSEIADVIQEGPKEWAQEWWGEVIVKGNIPLEVQSGKLVSDLTPLQEGVLWWRNVAEPPIPSPAHAELIDGVNVTLPGDLNLAEKNIGGQHYDALVDRKTGEVFDMSQYKFAAQDFDGDGKADLVILDQNGNLVGEANTVLTNLGLDGVKVSQGQDIVNRVELGNVGYKGPDLGPNAANIPGVNGNDIWKEADNYRVVHAGAESDAIAMNDIVFKTGNESHPLGVRFTFPDNMIHNPNTGATEHLMDAAGDGRVGILMEIPHYGQNGEDVSVYVPAHWDAGLNRFVVDFDPTDTKTIIDLPDGGHVTMAALSQNFLNEQKLSELGEGFQGTELAFDTRSAFNLANPDGLIEHQGRIHAGYWDPQSTATKWGFESGPNMSEGAFMAVHSIHGSEPLNLGEAPIVEPGPEIPTEPEIVETVTPTFVIEYQSPVEDFNFTVLPIPHREAIEQSRRGEPVQAASTVTTPPPAIDQTQTTPELTAEKRRELEDLRKQKLDRINQLEIESEKRELNEEEKAELDRLEGEIGELDSQLHPPTRESSVEKSESNRKEKEKYDAIRSELLGDIEKAKRNKEYEAAFGRRWGTSSEEAENNLSDIIREHYILRRMTDVQNEIIENRSESEKDLIKKIQRELSSHPEAAQRIFEKGSSKNPDEIAEIAAAELDNRLTKAEYLDYLKIARQVQQQVTQQMNQESTELEKSIKKWASAESSIKNPKIDSEKRIDEKVINQIVEKMKKKYSSGVGGAGRMGIEVNLSEEEFNQIEKLISASEKTWSEITLKDPDFKVLQEIIDRQNADPQKKFAFEMKKGLLKFFIEDANIETPQEVIDSNGKLINIKLPPKIYKLWQTKVIFQRLHSQFDKPIGKKSIDSKDLVHGNLAPGVGKDLENLFLFLSENDETANKSNPNNLIIPSKEFKVLNQELRQEYLKFWRRSQEAGSPIQITDFSTGKGKYFWQEVDFGKPIEKSSDELYRGYLMIDTEDFPRVLKIIRNIGEQRLKEGKNLNMKWLMMTVPPENRNKPEDYASNANHLGSYGNLDAADPRIVIYGETAGEIQEILHLLADHPEWQEIEQNRLDRYGGNIENAPRRPGRSALDHNGKEYRSLNWDENPGHSSDEAKDPNWRDKKFGTHTVLNI